MNTATPSTELQLSRRSIFNVADASGVQIVCHAGSVWITLDNDPRDIVLQAGDSFTGTDHRRAIVYALAESQLAVSDPALAASPRGAQKPAAVRQRSFAQAAA